MDYNIVFEQVRALLQREKRLAYRVLKRRLQLDDDLLEDLKDDLIYAKKLAVDEEGKVLVWAGGASAPSAPVPTPPEPVPLQSQPAHASEGAAPSVARHEPAAERRQLTVLFCDLVDSTALASQLDPEELRDVILAYQATCAEVIQRFDGHIAQYLGDGLLVYFGYPRAHEDDAQRAVWSGLGMVEAITSLNARLAVRLGIHTGLVVVGAISGGGRQEHLALGETPNVAARLQALAAPNTVVISATTHRLVQTYFTYADLGMHALKGVATPVQVYRVLQASGAQTRLDVAATRGLTPLVGRDAEVTLLLERWTQAKEGRGQVALLSGEPGIGKSRLVQVVKERVGDEPHARWECHCSPYAQNSALYPVIDLMQRTLHLQRDDAPEAKLGKLEGTLAHYHVSLPEVVPLFAALLSLPLPERYPPLILTPQRQKQKTLEAVLTVLLTLAEQQPVLFIMEDLHWVDPSTLELLSLVVDQGPTARLFTLLTCRPEFRLPWSARSHLTQLTLSRLPHTQVEVMVERVAGGKVLPAEVCQQMVAKTDGVPLFVEELTRMVLESGLLREREDHYELIGPLPPLAIPTTLHDSLMARLDRLAAVKEVAQLGATLGRTFSYELLQAVTPLDDAALQQALAQLVAAELLYQRGVPPQATYLFKHALIQEAAYQSLLKSTRQKSHQRIAQVLEVQFPETLETQPELLAYHYTEAGLSQQAIGYWQQAGRRAIERSAHVEAIRHLTRGLEVLTTMPETPERLRHELDLQVPLGAAWAQAKGWSTPEVGQAYARARELCQRLGEPPQLPTVLRGQLTWWVQRAEWQTAGELAEHLLTLAQRQADPALLSAAHAALGSTLVCRGAVAASHAHLAQGCSLYVPAYHRTLMAYHSYDLGVHARCYLALSLWLRGAPAQALAQMHEAHTLARELSDPYSLGFAFQHVTRLHQWLRDVPATLTWTEAMMALCTEHGFGQYISHARLLHGWALVAQGHGDAGLDQMRQNLTAYEATGAAIWRPYFLAVLADGYKQVGTVDEGLRVLAEALAVVQHTGEQVWEAELHRLKGALMLQAQHQPPTPAGSIWHATGGTLQTAEAEACFQQALAVARRQQATSLELRAAMSMARLWQQQGKQNEARALLAPTYGLFTEGFDTADLQEARVLLEELS
jgi:class 3 adenylate cyclase/predicted ATPase